MTTTTPVSDINDIDDVAAGKLAEHGIETVLDLLATPIENVIGIAGASRQSVQGWRSAAVLMHVEHITPERAGVLVDAGVRTLDAMLPKSASELTAIFTAAKDAGSLSEVPSEDELCGAFADCATLWSTGCLTGVVVDDEAAPVADAEVSVGKVATTSDSKGRFRLLRLPYNGPRLLSARSANNRVALNENATFVDSLALIAPQTLTLKPATEPHELNELAGDKLPPLAGVPQRLRRVELSELEEGDVLVAAGEPTADGRWDLFSRFRRYKDGTTYITVARASKTELGVESLTAGQAFEVADAALREIPAERSRRQMVLAQRALARDGPHYDQPPADEEEMRRRVTEMRQWLADHRRDWMSG